MEIKEERLKEELQHANVSLILEGYHDIFSSFDPRPYSEKALSDDFLIECKRAARDKDEDGFELILSLPKAKRIFADEVKIRKRLKDHFRKHYIEKEKENSKLKKKGVFWVFLGVIINILVVSGLINFESNLLHTILSIFEVPSWFLMWEGLGKIFIDPYKNEFEYQFYKKMSNVTITFRSY